MDGVMMKKQNRRLFEIGIICLFSALLFGCGYSFAPKGENVDNRIQKVYVESFDNKTAQAEIENYVRTAFINQFIQNSRFKVVESAESADAIVKGKILNLNTSPLAYDSNSLVAEERATIILELTFRENESGKIIWSSKNIAGGLADGSYYAAVAWTNAAGEEGASSTSAVIQVSGSSFAVQTTAPANVKGWNVYCGTSPATMTLQNSPALAPGQSGCRRTRCRQRDGWRAAGKSRHTG